MSITTAWIFILPGWSVSAARPTSPFGPGVSTDIVIIMDEWNNTDTNTLWEYTATVTCPDTAYLVFTENTNLAPVPIKFASPPFLPAGTNLDLYCLPEQSLNTLVGQSAFGTWQLEMWDTGSGAAGPATALASWQLRFVFQNTVPVPIGLDHGITGTNTIPPGQVAPSSSMCPPGQPRPPTFCLCLRPRELALQPDRAAHGHQRRRCHSAIRFHQRLLVPARRRIAFPGSRDALLPRGAEPRKRSV